MINDLTDLVKMNQNNQTNDFPLQCTKLSGRNSQSILRLKAESSRSWSTSRQTINVITFHSGKAASSSGKLEQILG